MATSTTQTSNTSAKMFWGLWDNKPTNLTKYMRQGEILFVGSSLCPDRETNMFFDDTPVTSLCQRGNPVVVTSADDAAKFKIGTGIINTTSGAYARVIGTSNNIVYIDQNYLTLKVGPSVGTPLSSSLFKDDDIVYQSFLVPREKVVTGDMLIPSTWTTYSDWLNRYGVWIIKYYGDEGQADPGSEDWSEYTYAACVTGTIERTYDVIFPTLPAGQTFQYAFACDNTGYFSIDGTKIKEFTTNQATNWTVTPTYTNIPLTFKANSVHTVKWSGTNLGGVSTQNPGSVGLHIKTSGGTTVFDSRNPVNVTGYDEFINFQARVKYFDSTSGLLALLPERGIINHTANVRESQIFMVNKPSTNCNLHYFITGTQYPLSTVIREVANTSNTATISSYTHYSGCYTEANSATQIYTQANVSSSIVGNTITFTAGSFNTANGTFRTITAVDGNLITLNSAITQISSNTRYSIGRHVVDDYGTICGIFDVPETEDAKFTAGDKLFTITDTTSVANNFYTMRGSAFYRASKPGEKVTPVPSSVSATLPVVRTTRVRTLTGFDPMAQTFFVPGANTTNTGEIASSYGIDVSSVDLFFAQKPSVALGDEQLPVTVRIVHVENDLPTGSVITEAVVEARNIKISNIPDAANTSTMTKFTFPHPVHLESNETYAITITSDSPYYNIFVAEGEKTILGTTRKVSTQPYVGKFFKAQNASTWTPILNADLMFRINRCAYITGQQGTALFKPKNKFLGTSIDTLVLHVHEENQKPTSTKYKVKANTVNGTDNGYQYIEVNTPYSFGSDLAISSKSSNRRRFLVAGDSNSMNVGIEMTTSDSTVSPIIYREHFGSIALQNIINDGSLANGNIVITSGGRHSNTGNITVTISAPDDPLGTQAYAVANLDGTISNTDIVFTNYGQHANAENISITFSNPPSGGTKANGYVQSIHANGNVSVLIIDNSGSGYVHTAPTITFSEPGTSVNASAVITPNVEKIILTGGGSGYYTSPTVTISEPSATVNAIGVVNGETGASGGNCKARYITKRVDLAPGFDAGDLRVFLDCIRPRGTNINVYYKVKADSDTASFDSKKWQLMYKVNDKFSIDQDQQIELEFRPNLLKNVLSYVENGVTYPIGGTFKSYAIKIVMTAADPTVIPMVAVFSAIATPEG